MANDKAATGEQPATANPQLPFLAGPEWVKSFSEAPIKVYGAAWKETLGFTASALQDQANYVKKLAECRDAAEALRCQWEFAQQSWIRTSDGASKFMDALRRNGWSGPAGK
jgi:Phasin protein